MKKFFKALFVLIFLVAVGILCFMIFLNVKGINPINYAEKLGFKSENKKIFIKRVKESEEKIPDPQDDKEAMESALSYKQRVGKLPILTYHYFIPGDQKTKNYAVVNANEFETMIKKLLDLGYTFIDTRDIKEALYETGSLPKKSVMISMDDGYRNNYEIAYPILKKYKVKATIFVIGTAVGSNERFLTWDMIKEMSDSGLVDIENHTYDMHSFAEESVEKKIPKLAYKFPTETDEEYVERIQDDLIKNNLVIEKHTGKRPVALSYPGGFWNKNIQKATINAGLYMGFIGANNDNFDIKNSSIYKIIRYNVYPGMDLDGFIKKLERD